MPILRAQVEFTSSSGLPEDTTMNVFHFNQPGLADYDNIRDLLEDFYDGVPSEGGNPIRSYLSSELSGEVTLNIYDLSDAIPRVPVFSDNFTWDVGADALPTEVALCVSWHAAPESGAVAARRRGRTFIGPLAVNTLNDADGRPTLAFRQQLQRQGRDLVDAAAASVSNAYVVYSPTDDEGNDIVGGWIDDSFDTIRKRGQAPTSRALFTDSTP